MSRGDPATKSILSANHAVPGQYLIQHGKSVKGRRVVKVFPVTHFKSRFSLINFFIFFINLNRFVEPFPIVILEVDISALRFKSETAV